MLDPRMPLLSSSFSVMVKSGEVQQTQELEVDD